MSDNRTNKEILAKGIVNMCASLLFIASGPVVLQMGFKLRNYLTITLGVILMFAAMFFIFRGIHFIMKAMFGDKK